MKLSSKRCMSQLAPRLRDSVLSSTLCGALLLADHASAQNVGSSDQDGDGLSLMQEKVLGTSPTQADTDGDGFSDLEELARDSSPLQAASTPDPTEPFGIGLTAHARADGIHVIASVYMADTDLRQKSLKLGLFSEDRALVLPSSYIAAMAAIDFKPSATPSGAVAVLDLPVDSNLVYAMGELTIWAHGAVPATPGQPYAAAIHLSVIDGIICYAMPAPAPVVSQSTPYHGQSGQQSGRGSIYVPLNPPQAGSSSLTAPAGWAPGEVCFQRSTLVGVNGASLTNEIVTADCLSGWDGFCPPTCINTVGNTYRTVDPLVLIGG